MLRRHLALLLVASACGQPTPAESPHVEPSSTAPAAVAAASSAPPAPPPPEPPLPADVPASPEPAPSAEAIARLSERLTTTMRAMTPLHSVLVTDASGHVLFADGADRSLIPASNTKLFTTAAAVDALGDDHRLTTRLLARGPVADGVLRGELVLAATGDFTWASHDEHDPGAVLDGLVAQLVESGVRRIEGAVRAEGTFFVDGPRAGDFDEPAQRRAARARLLRALSLRKIAVRPGPLAEAEETRTVASIASPPLIEAIAPINVHSHNAFAELLQRHLGAELAHDGSREGGARAIQAWLRDRKLPTEGVRLTDGSGLSRDDHATARAIGALLVHTLATHPRFVESLGVAGTSGTIGRRMLGDDTRGRVHAKTGTLAEVTALSGVVDNRHDGRRYVFAILQNGARDVATARRAEDAFVERLATAWNAEPPSPLR